jgi:hypothetical protein
MMGYPGIWGEAFERWVQEGRPRDAIIDFDSHDFALPADKLLATLWHCDDVMPDDVCGMLELPADSTYSIAVRKLQPAWSLSADSTLSERHREVRRTPVSGRLC